MSARGVLEVHSSGMVELAREANPDAEVETLGELLSLGEEEIRRQVDEDTQGPEGG